MGQKYKHLVKKGVSNIKKHGLKNTCFKVIRYFAYNNKVPSADLLNSRDCASYQDNFSVQDIMFSILVPLYNTPEVFLSEMIESVQKQCYTNWELCMADGSDEMHNDVEQICKRYMEKDGRIKYLKLEKL